MTLNCDLGEGIGNDATLMPYIDEANIACGFHAGDAFTMRETVALCIRYGVKMGAHPSYLDRENFGRKEIELSPEEIYLLVKKQIETLNQIVKTAGGTLNHVKPHGALYNTSAKNPDVAKAIAKAVKDVSGDFILFGLKGSQSIEVAKAMGLQTAEEAFADRRYENDGSLTPRSQPGACFTDVQDVLNQVEKIKADTWCIHGDGPHALEFAKALNAKRLL
ncbi:5-oxoprolinase subunit PxpA [Aquirufa sp. HETE-83D]|uniref:5-oxoprolinase subunit PxpA n=1 Tax=Aquirufa esocilacus TaxID=3096513 RepID=A0ABW6DHS3_9BACT